MYFLEVDDIRFVMKLMNCFGYMFIFKNSLYLYWDLLICMVEFGQVYCYEYSGVLNGMFCVWMFC